MEAYLDNAATTRVLPEVAELMTRVMTEDYGNPSSLHGKGFEAEKYIRTASEQIAATLKCEPSNIVFTSGGTESNNQALIGTALANKRRGRHIITTAFEHPSVHEPLLYLEQQGFDRRVVEPMRQMVADTRAQGLTVYLSSGYRDYYEQQSLFNNKVAQVGSREAAARIVLPPGTSEHQTGLACDITYMYVNPKNESLASDRKSVV